MSNTIAGPWQAFFSDSTSDPGRFFPLTAALDTAAWQPVSWQLEISALVGSDLRTRVAYEFSNDGLTWDTQGTLTNFVSPTNGWFYGTTFTSISAAATTSKRFLRAGLLVKKNASATLAFGRARLILIGREG